MEDADKEIAGRILGTRVGWTDNAGAKDRSGRLVRRAGNTWLHSNMIQNLCSRVKREVCTPLYALVLEDVLEVMFDIWLNALPSSGSWQSTPGFHWFHRVLHSLSRGAANDRAKRRFFQRPSVWVTRQRFLWRIWTRSPNEFCADLVRCASSRPIVPAHHDSCHRPRSFAASNVGCL